MSDPLGLLSLATNRTTQDFHTGTLADKKKKHTLLKIQDVKHVNLRVPTPAASKHIHRNDTNHKARD